MITDENNFSLEDIRQRTWVIVVDEKVRLVTPVEQGLFLRMIGEQLDQNTFRAHRIKIRPLHTPFGPCHPGLIPCESNR